MSSSPLTLALYATDASMYQFQPLEVVVPENRSDVLRTISVCAERKLPLLARGAGTSLNGQSIGESVILDVSKNMTRVLELNLEEGWVRVEPGLVCSNLNAYLKPYGVCFAPDPATQNRATIGGMIANNAAGMRSVLHGMTIDHVISLDLALANGEVLHLNSLDRPQWAAKALQPDREGDIYSGISRLLENNIADIRERYPKVVRRSGGYPLDALIDVEPRNLARLICGSEGTLGVILDAKLRLTPVPQFSTVCLAHFDSLHASMDASATILLQNPSAIELIDGIILQQARNHPLTRDITTLIEGEPAAILIIEVQGDNYDETNEHIRQIADGLNYSAYATPCMTDASSIQNVWQLRSSALGLMTNVEGLRKPVPYIEDAAIPPESLADYVMEVLAVCEKYDQPVSLFGHASVGLLHIRPLHDLHREADIAVMKQIQEEVFLLVQKYKGSWSGEHGDGIVRGHYNRRFFGDALYEAFKEVKRLFDPEGRINPGKVIETPPMDSHLRFGPDYKPLKLDTLFHFNKQGGILNAAEQCTGVGACRKTLEGVMCPSYMVTLDEQHRTLGRANALRLALTGQLGEGGLASDSLKETMELCLGCKGCKAECPNSVDMVQLKSEVLYHHKKKHGTSLRSWFFSNQANLASLASGWRAIMVNGLLAQAPSKWIFKKLLGVAPSRRLPRFTTQRLSKWYKNRVKSPIELANQKRVIFFNETYTEHYLPQVGQAAIEVLEAAGYEVKLASLGDSQRSAISQGFLDEAKNNGTRLFREFDTLFSGEEPIIVCEPSSASALVDDLPDLLDDVNLTKRVASRVHMIDEFLEKELAAGRCVLPWKEEIKSDSIRTIKILIHDHCHQKSIDGGGWTQRLLDRIPNSITENTNAGCCGMAGSFGYEVEHAVISSKIAEQRLLPAIERSDPETYIVSNGFSCRHQIDDLSERESHHVIELVRKNCMIN